jgi:hypothetical protein
MAKITQKSVLILICFALLLFVISVSSNAQEKAKLYEEIAGDYEYEYEGQYVEPFPLCAKHCFSNRQHINICLQGNRDSNEGKQELLMAAEEKRSIIRTSENRQDWLMRPGRSGG